MVLMESALIILISLVFFAALFQRLKFGVVLGYLGGGILIGPHGLGLEENSEAISHLAELGVVFLLFSLGLELKLERLKLFGARAYGFATAQFFATTGFIIVVAAAAGMPAESAVVVGCGLALSSTAVVLQVMKDLGKTVTKLGRFSIATLLVQDMAVGPLLVLVKTLGAGQGALGMELLGAGLKAVIVLVFVILIGRFFLRPLLNFAASTGISEVFAGTTLLVVLGAAWLTDAAGLSMALGAFIAGIMVAGTEFHHQVAADISPFRGLLLGLFFLSVGMTIDLDLALAEPKIICLMVVGLMVCKGVIIFILGQSLGFDKKLSLQLGGVLSQGSEFAFVLFGLAMITGVLDGYIGQLLIISIAITMAVTPIGAIFARKQMDGKGSGVNSNLDELDRQTAAAHGHVLVVGFGQVGKAVTRHLVGMEVPVLVLDLDARRVAASKEHNLPVFYGNAERLDVLRAVHLDQASLVILTIPDTDIAVKILQLIKRTYPKTHVMTRAREEDDVKRLIKAGAEAAAIDGLTTAMELAERALLVFEPDAVMAGEADPPIGKKGTKPEEP